MVDGCSCRTLMTWVRLGGGAPVEQSNAAPLTHVAAFFPSFGKEFLFLHIDGKITNASTKSREYISKLTRLLHTPIKAYLPETAARATAPKMKLLPIQVDTNVRPFPGKVKTKRSFQMYYHNSGSKRYVKKTGNKEIGAHDFGNTSPW